MPRNEQYVVGLDVGTSQVSCVVAEVRENEAIHIVGLGECRSRGIRKGVVVNLDATVEAIRSAVEQAELMAGVSVDSVVSGIAGGHIRSFNSRGVVSVSGKDRTVSRDDCRRVLDAARAVTGNTAISDLGFSQCRSKICDVPILRAPLRRRHINLEQKMHSSPKIQTKIHRQGPRV